MNTKRILAAAAALSLSAVLFSGCGKLNGSETVATLDGKEIEVGLVNLKAQITAASYDSYLAGYYGEDMWESDLAGDGTTLADEVREETLEAVELQYLLEEHMADYGVTLSDKDLADIETYTAKLLADNTAEALEVMGAEEEYVREMFRLTAIETRMREAIEAEADTTVTEDDLAESEDATEESIIADRQAELYSEVTEGYLADADWTVNEKVLAKINFDHYLTIIEETAEETEAAFETEE